MGSLCKQGFDRVVYLSVMTRLYGRYDFQKYTPRRPLTATRASDRLCWTGDLLEGTHSLSHSTDGSRLGQDAHQLVLTMKYFRRLELFHYGFR